MRLIAALALFALTVPVARAEEPSAAAIIERSRQAGALGLVNARADIKLLVDDGHGGTRERQLTAAAIQLPTDVRRLVRFVEPSDVRGVAVLVVEKPGEPADRFLYLPSQKRVRRISGKQGGQSFEETDFSYADLDLAGGQGDQLTREPDAQVEGNPCWVVTTVPAESPYGKIVTYVHQKTSVPLQILFYGKDGSLAKRLKATRVKQVDGRWYAFESVMESVGKGTHTTLTITRLDTKAALSADDFTEQALARE